MKIALAKVINAAPPPLPNRITDRPLADAGGKGLFTKEIEEALIREDIDFAVHSAKDVPTMQPDGLTIAGYLPREDARDVFISAKARTLKELPKGSRVGTASPRRQALVKHLRPDLETVLLRGNVETRLRKLDEGEADATILALAGLKRLGLEGRATAILAPEEFLPAAGQGAIAIETRAGDDAARQAVALINDADTETALIAERAFLAELDGSCRAPIAAHANVTGGIVLQFRGMILKPDGSAAHETSFAGNRKDAAQMGADAGWALRQRGGKNFFE